MYDTRIEEHPCTSPTTPFVRSVAEVAAWMDWSRPTGLTTPAPATFVDGTNEMPQGQSAYLTVDLEPGRYAWVSERGASVPMDREFEVR